MTAMPQKPITNFLELGLPFGSQLQQPPTDGNGTSDNTVVIGFRVRPAERALILEYVNCMRKYPLPNPSGGQPIQWIDQDSIGLMIKNATIAYMMQYNFFMASIAERQRQMMAEQQQAGGQPPGGQQGRPQQQKVAGGNVRRR